MSPSPSPLRHSAPAAESIVLARHPRDLELGHLDCRPHLDLGHDRPQVRIHEFRRTCQLMAETAQQRRVDRALEQARPQLLQLVQDGVAAPKAVRRRRSWDRRVILERAGRTTGRRRPSAASRRHRWRRNSAKAGADAVRATRTAGRRRRRGSSWSHAWPDAVPRVAATAALTMALTVGRSRNG